MKNNFQLNICCTFLALSFLGCPKTTAQISFKPYQEYVTGSRAVSLVLDDLNQDGLDDIALATGWASGGINNYKLFIYYQNPNGNLDNPLIFPYPESWYDGARSIDIGDLNHDMKKDIAIVHNDSISVFYQVSRDDFKRVGYYSGTTTDGLKINDLNHDGFDDVAVTHVGALYMNVFYQDSLAQLNKVSYPSPEGSSVQLDFFDLNHDSLNDLVYLARYGVSNGLFFYLQNAHGELNLPFSYNTGLQLINGMASGFLNQDDRKDIALVAGGNYPAELAILMKDTANFQFLPPDVLTA